MNRSLREEKKDSNCNFHLTVYGWNACVYFYIPVFRCVRRNDIGNEANVRFDPCSSRNCSTSTYTPYFRLCWFKYYDRFNCHIWARFVYWEIGFYDAGSTDTTFYILTVYFGAVGIRKMGDALKVGLLQI